MIMRDGLLLMLMIVLFIWSIPLLSQLLFLGSIATPITLVVLGIISVAGFVCIPQDIQGNCQGVDTDILAGHR